MLLLVRTLSSHWWWRQQKCNLATPMSAEQCLQNITWGWWKMKLCCCHVGNVMFPQETPKLSWGVKHMLWICMLWFYSLLECPHLMATGGSAGRCDWMLCDRLFTHLLSCGIQAWWQQPSILFCCDGGKHTPIMSPGLSVSLLMWDRLV